MNSQVMQMLRENANYNDRTGSTLGSGYIGGCMGCPTCKGSGYIGGFRNAAGKRVKVNGLGEHAFFAQHCGLKAKGPGSTARNKARKLCVSQAVQNLPPDVLQDYNARGPKRVAARNAYNQRVSNYMAQYDLPKNIAKKQLAVNRRNAPKTYKNAVPCTGFKNPGMADFCRFKMKMAQLARETGKKGNSRYNSILWALIKYKTGQDLSAKQIALLDATGAVNNPGLNEMADLYINDEGVHVEYI